MNAGVVLSTAGARHSKAFRVAYRLLTAFPMTADPTTPNSPPAGVAVLEVVGQCSRCGVSCVGVPARREWLERLLASHERICPGGNRHGEEWMPTPL